jgi:hypothetical protein
VTRPAGVKVVVTSLVALVLIGATLVPPGTAHVSPSATHNWRRHYKPPGEEDLLHQDASEGPVRERG